MTRNQDLNVLHVDNATAFVDNLKWRVVSLDTLLFDFVYFLHPVRCHVNLCAVHDCMTDGYQNKRAYKPCMQA